MKILFIGPMPEPTTGQSLACQVLLEHLKLQHTVTVIDLVKRSLSNSAITFSRVQEILSVLFKVWKGRHHADIIYFNVSESIPGNLKDLMVFLILRGQLARVVIHLHGGAGMKQRLAQRSWLRGLNAYFLRRLGGIIVLGERLRKIYDGIVPGDRVHEVPNFAEDYLFCDWSEVACKFDDTSVLRVLFLSNLIPGKGHEELIAAYRLLGPELRARIIIEFAGGFETPADESCFRRSIADDTALRYLGVVKGRNKRDVLYRSHVFCLPTYYPFEGQPISLLEAYASGCVVITTDHSGIFDIFMPGRNGLAVEKRSAVSLKSALESIATNSNELRAIARTNQVYAKESFRSEQFCNRVEDVLVKVYREEQIRLNELPERAGIVS